MLMAILFTCSTGITATNSGAAPSGKPVRSGLVFGLISNQLKKMFTNPTLVNNKYNIHRLVVLGLYYYVLVMLRIYYYMLVVLRLYYYVLVVLRLYYLKLTGD